MIALRLAMRSETPLREGRHRAVEQGDPTSDCGLATGDRAGDILAFRRSPNLASQARDAETGFDYSTTVTPKVAGEGRDERADDAQRCGHAAANLGSDGPGARMRGAVKPHGSAPIGG